jgi:hypothetical protein
MLKITAKTLKPRNPLVGPSLFRKSGSHAPSGRGQRQQAQQALRRELKALDPSPPSQSP